MTAWWRSLQVAFTFIGTVVGAGFASGREVMQFFTRFGNSGVILILAATVLFVWVGSKIMLLAAGLKARSYEDLNKHLFGERFGRWSSHLMLFILLAVNAIMLAGGGTIFSEHLGMNYQVGMLLTMLACFLLLRKGMSAILAINTFVVPIMMLFTVYLLVDTMQNYPGFSAGMSAMHVSSPWAAGMSPLLYGAFNLSLAQAVLVPLGSSIGDPRVLRRGAWMGGVGIGTLLLAGHFTMIAHMPEIALLDIPMGGIAQQFGVWIHGIYILLIYSEIFTTLVSDIFGLNTQLQDRIRLRGGMLTAVLLVLCFIFGQFGFGPLLSTLYPLFGMLSLGWLFLIIRDRSLRHAPPRDAPPKESGTRLDTLA